MNTPVRRKLDMAVRVREFNRARPTDNARFTQTLSQLEERLTRAQDLDTQQQQARDAGRASTANRARLRKDIREHPLRHLARFARAASTEEPGLGKLFRAPLPKANSQTFLTRSRAMAASAAERKDMFVGLGMPATFLDELNAGLDQFAASLNEGRAQRIRQVGANADLEAVTEEVMQLVSLLDAMNRYRFRDDAEQLAAWESARNIAWPNEVPQAPAEGGTVRPAA